jgi:hypothetical protein
MNILAKLRQLPVIGWVAGHWAVIVAFAAVLYFYTTGSLALTGRAVLMIPMFVLMAIVSTTFATNVALRGTSAKHRRNKTTWEKDWKNLTPFQRVIVCKIDVWVVLIIAGLIAAATLLLVNVTVAPL